MASEHAINTLDTFWVIVTNMHIDYNPDIKRASSTTYIIPS